MTNLKVVAGLAVLAVAGLAMTNVASAAAPPPPAPRPPAERPARPNPSTTTTTAAPAAPAADGTVAVTITSGHATDPVDHGRPVVLIAAALGVPTEVFRTAFSGVTPAGPGSGGPTEAEAQANKQALLSVLAPYGVTNARLDEVSNHYRYAPGSTGAIWTHRDATATATVVAGRVTSITITDAGAGYSSAPTITVPGVTGQTFTATVAYGTDLATNGRISAVTIGG